jgi:hypothetical protein
MRTLLQTALYSAAFAMPAAHAAQPVPLPAATAGNPSAPVPAPFYESAFTGYQRYRGQALAPWREINDEVHKAGGHTGIVGGAAGRPAAAKPAHPAEHKP